MPTPTTDEATARTVDEQFLDLICSDPDLLGDEFDAIIAEEWPDPPVSLPRREAAGRKPERGRSGRRRSAAHAHAEQKDPLGDAWRRQRSPPVKSTSYRDRKGR